MRVYLSTGSQLKHEVVKEAFASIGQNVETVAIPTDSGVNDQPMSIEETYRGASNRQSAMKAQLGSVASGDCFITVESGIFVPIPERGSFFGVNALIVECNGKEHVGIDTDIEFPKQMTDRIPSDYPDLGALVRAEHGASENDPIQVFTNGLRSRRGFMKTALLNVLVQFEEFAEGADS